MRHARTVPGAFGMPELRSFLCAACGEAVTLEMPLSRPVQSTTPNFPSSQTVAK